MINQVSNNKMKLCKNCNIVKPLEEGLYKAGRGWQTNCSPCHNQIRKKWVI